MCFDFPNNVCPKLFHSKHNSARYHRCTQVFNVCNSVTAPSEPGPTHYLSFTIILRHITHGRTPMDEWSARRRDVYLATHNIHKRQTSMKQTGFDPAIPTGKRPRIHALERADTGVDSLHVKHSLFLSYINTKNFLYRLLKNNQISWKSVQWEPSCSMLTDRDGRTDKT
jgi:hypothetical protein